MNAQGKTIPVCGAIGRPWRLATNDNETIMISGPAGTTWRLAGNDNETVAQDEDTEGHRLAGNDKETIIPGARRFDGAGDSDGEGDGADDPQQPGLRR